MRSGSPQGYSGRRVSYSGNGGPGDTKQVDDIWEVVSALASALQDARNQLVNLMNTSRGKPMRLYGGRTSSYESCDSRFSLTPHVSPSRGIRNVHRGHSHGHVAFGLNSEFPLYSSTPMRVRRAQSTSAQRALRVHPAAAGSPRRCTHPLHGMGADAKSLTPRRGAQAKWPSSQVADCRKSHWDELSRRDRACVNISSGIGQSKNGSGAEHRRHGRCIGTQFISLLKQEAHQIRERRLAEESPGQKAILEPLPANRTINDLLSVLIYAFSSSSSTLPLGEIANRSDDLQLKTRVSSPT